MRGLYSFSRPQIASVRALHGLQRARLRTQSRRDHQSLPRSAARHTSQDFVEFLGEVVARCERDQEIHIILDNLSAHKTKQMAAFLEQHPDVALHFTPTYSSWLNQVELWFSKLQRDVIARGVFTSTCAGSAGTGEGAFRASVDAALRAGIFKVSGSFDPMGFWVERERWLPRPRSSSQ